MKLKHEPKAAKIMGADLYTGSVRLNKRQRDARKPGVCLIIRGKYAQEYVKSGQEGA